jgi:hypothetical protein
LAAAGVYPSALRRIVITTVCFRDRFATTRDNAEGPLPFSTELTLLTAPRFIADTLGLNT